MSVRPCLSCAGVPIGGSHLGAFFPWAQGHGHVGSLQPQHEAANLVVPGQLPDGLELQAPAPRLPLCRPQGARAPRLLSFPSSEYMRVCCLTLLKFHADTAGVARCRVALRGWRGRAKTKGSGKPSFWRGWAKFLTGFPTGLFHRDPRAQAAVYSVAFNPQTSIIASGSKDRTVRLWQPTVYVPRPFPASPPVGQSPLLVFRI